MVAETIHLCGGVKAVHRHSYIRNMHTKVTAIDTVHLISGKSYKRKEEKD